MGRTRTRDKHLPRRLYLERGTYFFRPLGGRRLNLGKDYSIALTEYAKHFSESWAGRTVGDVIDRYRIEVLPLKRSAKTRKSQQKELDRLKVVFGSMIPDSITALHCYRYMDGRRDKHNNPVPVAARHEIALLGHVMAKSIRWGVSTLNATRGLDFGPRAGKRAKVAIEQVEALKALASPRMRLAIRFAVEAGQRRGDLLACRDADCTDEGILFRQSKTGAEVLVAWSDELKAIVRELRALAPQIPREFLLRKRNGRPYSGDGFSSTWQRLMTKHVAGGGQQFSFHDLRSVSADGADTPEEARDRLGHASVETTKRHYLHGPIKAKPRSR